MLPCFSLSLAFCILDDIEQNAKIMQNGAGQDKQMPDGMKVFLFAGKKADAGGIHDAAQHQQNDDGYRQRLDQGEHSNDDTPARSNVADHAKDLKAL